METPKLIRGIIDDAKRENLTVGDTATKIVEATDVNMEVAYTMIFNYSILGL